MSTSKYLHLFNDSKAADPFEIQATANDAVFSYANKPLKMNGDLQYKSGVAYVSLVSKLGLVDQSIVNEATTARAAESKNAADLLSAVALLDADVVDLNAQIQTEIGIRSSTDTSFNQAIAAETLARQTADTTNANNIVIEKNRAEAFEASLNIMINTEATRALGIEGTLRTDLTAEIADRKTAITGEAKSRSDADLALGVRVDTEYARAYSVEVANFQTLDGYIATEQARAMTKENSLQSQVNFMIHNVDAKAMDSLAEIVGKLNSAGTDLYARVLYLEQVVSTLRGEALYAAAQTVYVAGVAPSAP